MPVSQGVYFYWGFYAHKDSHLAPLCLHFGEGPGVSILIDIFASVGPYKYESAQKITENPYAWNKHVNMLFIEAPLGTGLSTRYEKKIKGHAQSFELESEAIIEFLIKFVEMYPEFGGRDLILSGESSGTQISIPLGYKLLKSTLKKPNLKLKGLFLNSPCLNVFLQFAYIPQFLYKHKRITKKRYQEMKLVADLFKQNLQPNKQPINFSKYMLKFFYHRNRHSLSVDTINGVSNLHNFYGDFFERG